MPLDEFSGLDQVTHATGALVSIEGGTPQPPQQHVAESLRSRTALNNSLQFQSNSSRRPGTPPMPPGQVTAAVPRPVGYYTPPGFDQNGPPPGPIVGAGMSGMGSASVPQGRSNASRQADQHANLAQQYAGAAAQLRAQGRHRDAAEAIRNAQHHANMSAQLGGQSTGSLSNAGDSGATKGANMSNQPSLQNVDPNRYFEQPLGFVQKAIATVSTGSAVSKPQDVFRPTRLLIPSPICPFFTIQNLRIGTSSQLVGTTEMPAQVYSELAVGAAFLLGTANIGIEISIDVTNVDTVTHDFRAVMMGQTFK